MRHACLLALFLAACSGSSSSSSSSGGSTASSTTSSSTTTSGSSSSTTSSSSSTSGSTSGTSTSSSSSTSSSGSTGGLAACTAPTAQNGVSFAASGSQRFGPPALAWAGSEGALVVAESTGTGWSVSLARLTQAGLSAGAPVSLGTNQLPNTPPTLGVAASGSAYLACWDGDGNASANVACALVPAGGSSATAAFTVVGSAPSVAYGAVGFVVAYVDGSGHLSVQQVDASGAASGAPLDVGAGSLPVIVGRDAPYGYAIGHLDGSGALVANFLDPSGVIGQELETFSSQPGLGSGYPYALASSGAQVAAVWMNDTLSSAPIVAAVRSGGVQAGPASISSTAASYGRVAVAGAASSYAATWSDQGGSIEYVALDSNGAALAAAVPVASVNWDDNAHALVALPDGFLLATTVNMGADHVQVVHLGCP